MLLERGTGALHFKSVETERWTHTDTVEPVRPTPYQEIEVCWSYDQQSAGASRLLVL
ncbi:hypothetical protein [Candidatus Nitrospira neomarina]|uniref:Uncharacterized protein n=1 Tax=Candidatus Nitrospira neomarina TaxID=3020899 RepID=A0AA96JWZ1_9BACT|nr:hypothetical protein [Candidatus Nitrospira neomarina]WNM62550.1 hypothetical protein PQG83_02040 [Candidatus Nitrospira neomarina]